MATTKQKAAARKNIAKARKVQSARAHGKKVAKHTNGLSTAQKNRLDDEDFAFPKERKEPLTDAKHVRNAVARFDQVEDVTDAERDPRGSASRPRRRSSTSSSPRGAGATCSRAARRRSADGPLAIGAAPDRRRVVTSWPSRV